MQDFEYHIYKYILFYFILPYATKLTIINRQNFIYSFYPDKTQDSVCYILSYFTGNSYKISYMLEICIFYSLLFFTL